MQSYPLSLLTNALKSMNNRRLRRFQNSPSENPVSRRQEDASYSVATLDDIILIDRRRKREVPLKVYYPKEASSCPVIIFSHGAGGSKEGFSHLGEFWASKGYVSIHPTHVGSDTSVLKLGGFEAIRETASDPYHWQIRTQDISFIIDSLNNLQQRKPVLENKLNTSLVGVAGHSYGAQTAMLVAGTLVTTPWSRWASFRDDRVKAFLAISPQGTTHSDQKGLGLGLSAGSWAQIKSPVMTMSGTEDFGNLDGISPAWRLEPFQYMPPGDKYHVLLVGAKHSSYGDRGDEGRNANQIRTYIRVASTAFWDAYLKQSKQAESFLKSKHLETKSRGIVTIMMK